MRLSSKETYIGLLPKSLKCDRNLAAVRLFYFSFNLPSCTGKFQFWEERILLIACFIFPMRFESGSTLGTSRSFRVETSESQFSLCQTWAEFIFFVSFLVQQFIYILLKIPSFLHRIKGSVYHFSILCFIPTEKVTGSRSLVHTSMVKWGFETGLLHSNHHSAMTLDSFPFPCTQWQLIKAEQNFSS